MMNEQADAKKQCTAKVPSDCLTSHLSKLTNPNGCGKQDCNIIDSKNPSSIQYTLLHSIIYPLSSILYPYLAIKKN